MGAIQLRVRELIGDLTDSWGDVISDDYIKVDQHVLDVCEELALDSDAHAEAVVAILSAIVRATEAQ